AAVRQGLHAPRHGGGRPRRGGPAARVRGGRGGGGRWGADVARNRLSLRGPDRDAGHGGLPTRERRRDRGAPHGRGAVMGARPRGGRERSLGRCSSTCARTTGWKVSSPFRTR